MEFNLKFILSVYAAQIQRSTVCEAAGVFSLLLKIHPVAPETVTSQKQGDSEKETISKSLSILADSSALKYHFSQKRLAQF